MAVRGRQVWWLVTDRIKGFVVVLEKDMREEDAERIMQAVRQLRGVCKVEAQAEAAGDYFVRMQVMAELRDKLWDVLR